MSKSRSTTDGLPPVHPGEILTETLEGCGLSINRLAQDIRVPAKRISSIIAEQHAITGETASWPATRRDAGAAIYLAAR
jgi:addiction module HigA family antidote